MESAELSLLGKQFVLNLQSSRFAIMGNDGIDENEYVGHSFNFLKKMLRSCGYFFLR